MLALSTFLIQLAMFLGRSIGMMTDPIQVVALFLIALLGYRSHRLIEWSAVFPIGIALQSFISWQNAEWHRLTGLNEADRFDALVRSSTTFIILASLFWGIGRLLKRFMTRADV